MNTFKCKYCGKEFSPQYRIGKKIITFCSKSCKTKWQKQGYHSKSELEHAIKKLIKAQNRYLTKNDILEQLKISSKTLSRFNISVLSLNKEAGMKKPQSAFEFYICEKLEELFDIVETQKTFLDCCSPKGYLLKFDFYIPEKNMLIEADGEQHFNNNHYMSSEYTIACDKIKNEYCLKNNIKLVRIPYSKKVTTEYILKYID